MFLGHFGLGFAGKRVAPALSLGALFLAVQWADLLFWILALLGIEHFRIQPCATRMTPMDFYDYPISHSLAGLLVWGALLGGGYFLLRRDSVAALVLGAGVVSHWVLDVLVHRPDMPVLPAGPRVGLSIWDSPPLTGRTRDPGLRRRHRDLHEDDARGRSRRALGALDPDRVPRRRLGRKRGRPAAAERARRRVVRPRDVALRPVGVLDRPPPRYRVRQFPIVGAGRRGRPPGPPLRPRRGRSQEG